MWMNTKKSSIKSIPCLDSIFTFGKVIKLEFGPRGTQTFDSASNPHFHLLPLITPMLALNFQWKLSHKRFVTLNSHPTWHVSIGYIESSVCAPVQLGSQLASSMRAPSSKSEYFAMRVAKVVSTSHVCG